MTAPATGPEVSCRQLFLAFLRVGVRAFGGVMPWARHMLVDQHRWLDDVQFTHLLSLAQPLPGPNSLNLAVLVGDRFQGPLGALSALAGLLSAPVCIVLTLAAGFDRFGQAGPLHRLLPGISAAAAGLVAGTGLRLLARMERRAWTLVLALLAFLAVAWLRLPLLPVLLVLGPAGVAFARRGEAR
jgi:chromate transporter